MSSRKNTDVIESAPNEKETLSTRIPSRKACKQDRESELGTFSVASSARARAVEGAQNGVGLEKFKPVFNVVGG